MSSNRILKVNELLTRQVSQIIKREIDFPKTMFVTVEQIETSPDLQNARVFMSVYPASFLPLAQSKLNKGIYNIQKILDKKLLMRPVPKIRFVYNNPEKEERINELLKEIETQDKA